jgi:hypothetical protein
MNATNNLRIPWLRIICWYHINQQNITLKYTVQKTLFTSWYWICWTKLITYDQSSTPHVKCWLKIQGNCSIWRSRKVVSILTEVSDIDVAVFRWRDSEQVQNVSLQIERAVIYTYLIIECQDMAGYFVSVLSWKALNMVLHREGKSIYNAVRWMSVWSACKGSCALVEGAGVRSFSRYEIISFSV